MIGTGKRSARGIPDAAFRFEVTPSTQDRETDMAIIAFTFSPFPDIAAHVIAPEWASALGK